MPAKLQVLNDSTSSPLRFILEDGKTFGQFYNSKDKQYHLAEYVPYRGAPRQYVCGKTGNMSPSRSTNNRDICKECFCGFIRESV